MSNHLTRAGTRKWHVVRGHVSLFGSLTDQELADVFDRSSATGWIQVRL